ncbi:MAG: HlyD family efflux transporter periplasmic adaptor subunit [Planctomycetota bacterium]|nr:HlyD family efflux transporter periplasmic adaptor subunit [Planctomycetota bacterium]
MSSLLTEHSSTADRRTTLFDREAVFPALRLVRASRTARRVAKWLIICLLSSVIAMAFAPWQQTIAGRGNVVAFAPIDRRQIVESPVNGRIVRWDESIRENTFVREGQFILEIQDMDPQLIDRLKLQLEAGQRQVNASEAQIRAAKSQVDLLVSIIETFEAQVAAFRSVREEVVGAATEYIRMAESKVKAEEQNLQAASAGLRQAEADYKRQKQLHAEGLASELKMQLAERKYQEALAKQEQAQSYIDAARSELSAKKRERDAKEREAQAKVDSVRASLQKAQSDVAKAQGDVAKTESDLAKFQKEVVEAQVKLARQENQTIVAPCDGYLMDLVATRGGAYVKVGDPLFEIVPQVANLAAQVWIDGNDVPLVSPGKKVRMQFEGWPAVQFSGWPSVAVGTFGGVVSIVDSTDDGQGRFRVVIVPDEDSDPWPTYPYLRQGARANGWILLDRVRLGYEMWRRLNGFPPALKSKAGEVEKAAKPPKIKI